MAWTIEYYSTPSGNEPVIEWLDSMSRKDRATAQNRIDRLAVLGIRARAPLVKPLGDKLYELRWEVTNRQHRIIYFAWTGQTFVLLHGFVKKTQATPKRDLDLARDRMRDYEKRFAP